MKQIETKPERRVIDVGADVFEQKSIPVLVGAPSLGRYCVFGNLFARAGAESGLSPQPASEASRHPASNGEQSKHTENDEGFMTLEN